MNENTLYGAMSGGLPDLRANSELPFVTGPKRATPYESVMSEFRRVQPMTWQGIREAGYDPKMGGELGMSRDVAIMCAVAERLLGEGADFEVMESIGGEPGLRIR